ncbi:hypothetical protein C1646_761110 [Rhizophagus diaphanus]|nr:hypothetical protein C1646_761110 [Rhizophagus diaphanus] [Rhizophagus sp. MUCL 43196]
MEEVVKNIVKNIKNEVRDIINEVKDIKNEVSGLDLKMEQVTGTDKGKIVMEKGAHISYPLDLITSSKRSGNGKFTSPPNKNADPKRKKYNNTLSTNARN